MRRLEIPLILTAILLLLCTVSVEANETSTLVPNADVAGLCGGQAALAPAGEDQRFDASDCTCPTAASPNIAHGWGCASTCAEATSACSANAASVAQAACDNGVCQFGNLTLNPASGCVYNHSMCPGQYLRDCDREYWCWLCVEKPDRPYVP